MLNITLFEIISLVSLILEACENEVDCFNRIPEREIIRLLKNAQDEYNKEKNDIKRRASQETIAALEATFDRSDKKLKERILHQLHTAEKYHVGFALDDYGRVVNDAEIIGSESVSEELLLPTAKIGSGNATIRSVILYICSAAPLSEVN